jgi:DNA polymerase I-like protein with 3'-5' exonuclease and polymerase domains
MDVVFDIEADNLYSTVTKLHCIALKRIGIDKDVLLFDRENIKEGICILKSADRLIGHNIIQYDIPVIEKLYDIKLTTNVLDTINLSMICFPEYKQHGLEHWGQRLGFEKFNPVTGKEYTDEEWKERKGIKQTVWDVYTDEMGAYCKQDVRITELVLWKCNINNIDPYVIELSNNFSRIIAEQVNNGCRIDKEGLLKLQSQIEVEEQRASKELLSKLPDFVDYDFKIYKRNNQNKNIKAGDIEAIEIVTPFNLQSTQHWMRYLKTKYDFDPPLVRRKGKKDPTPCLDDDVLAKLEDVYPEVTDLLLWKTANKIRKMIYTGDTSVYNLLDKNNIIRGGVKTDGTVSGRCAHNNPNLATMPGVRTNDQGIIRGIKGKYAYEVRSLFIPRPGFVQVGFDAKGLEYMCLAHFINNPEFTNIIENGDIHTWTQKTLGFAQRRQAKTFEYAYLYGAGKKTLAENLSKGTDKTFTIKDVDEAINKFVSALPGLEQLHKDLKRQYQEKGTITGLDKRELHARSDYSLLNLLLQSSGAVVMKQCLVFLQDELIKAGLIKTKDYNFLLNIHDEVQAEVRPTCVELYKGCAQKAVDRTNKFLNLNCKLQIDIKTGKSWAECH